MKQKDDFLFNPILVKCLAPDGCLQYYQGVTGTLMTFNYMDAAGLQLSNTDYTQCIRSERNFCGIQYTACPDTGKYYFKWLVSTYGN